MELKRAVLAIKRHSKNYLSPGVHPVDLNTGAIEGRAGASRVYVKAS